MSEPQAETPATSVPNLLLADAASPPAAAPVPPLALRLDSGVALLVVAVCIWQRHRFIDLTDPWLLALSLFFPVGNLLIVGLSLRAYKLSRPALHYRMALGALFTLYYGYVALHLAGLSESPLGALLLNAVGSTPNAKIASGVALFGLLVQTFVATDACQKTLSALPAAPPLPAFYPATATAAPQL